MSTNSTVSLSNANDYVCGENTGAHGNIYQRDLAFVLFVRGTMKKYKFKVGTEMTAAGKFDDVIVYVEDLDETWLFQAKHANMDGSKLNKISDKELFPSEERLQGKDFDLFKYMKSYTQVESEINGKKRYFIFTNKDLENSGKLKKWARDASGDVDAMMDFSDFDGAYKTFDLNENDVTEMLPMVNDVFYKIKNAIVKVFNTGEVDKVLMNYKTPVAKILSIKNTALRFSDDFLTGNNDSSSVEELYKVLQEDFKDQELSSVQKAENSAIKRLLDKTNSRIQEFPAFLNETKVTAFFKSLTLCVNQPNELRIIVDKDIHMWLRTWVRPDYLGKFSESQMKLPVTKLDEVFKSWNEKGADKSKNKPFLCSDKGSICWDMIIKELEQFTTQLPDVLKRYYVNREVIFTGNDDANRQHSGISDNELSKQLTDRSNEDKCIALIADPGMGKTTLMQYVSFEAQKLTKKVIFLIYLNSLKDKLLEKSECHDLKGALDIIGFALSVSNNSRLNNIFIDKKDKEGKEDKQSKEDKENGILFFLDGFDEVPASENSKLISVVQQLQKMQRVRIVISGRKHVKNDLKDALAAKVMYLKPFRSIDQVVFLEKFWNISHEDPIVFPKFQKYADKLLDRFHTNIYSFMKMPLMIRLLAEVYTDDFERFMQSENETDRLYALSTEVFSVVSLFEQFVRKSFCMKMFKKFNLDPYSKNEPYDDEMDPLFEQYTLEHELEAINSFRYKREMKNVLTANEEKYNKFRKRIEDRKEKTLLINLTEPHTEFVHQSIAEYFVARYLYKNMRQCVDYLCTILDDMTLIRSFFYLILDEKLDQSSDQICVLSTICGSNNLVAFWACEALCLNVLKNVSSNHDLRTFFSEEYGSLLHVAAQNGSYEICLFLLSEVKIEADCLSCEEFVSATETLQADNQLDEQLSIKYQVTAFHLAAAYEHKSVVELLLKHSADVNARNAYLFTALHVAARNGLIDMIELLIVHSADLNVQTHTGDTPLHFAIDFSQVHCAEILIERGANVNISNNYGSIPLVMAVTKGFHNIVAQLIKMVDIDHLKIPTLLHLAAGSGNLELVKQIIPLSVEIDAPDRSGATPLYYAASKGSIDIVEYLIELNCSVNALENNKCSPLHGAIMNGRRDVVKVLIAQSADVNFQDDSGKTSLNLAAQGNHLDIVKLLLDQPVDVNAADQFKKTAFHYAAKNNKPLIMKLLLDHLADPNLADIGGWTPLHFAAHEGSLEAVELLVEQSININALTIEQQTPLHLAVKSQYRDIVEILIRKSADLNTQDKNNRTPLHVAINTGSTHLLDLLITRDNVNMQDHQNMTPLLLAAQTNKPVSSVKLLIEKNSNVNACRKDGGTALHWTAEKGHFDIAVLLIERLAHVNAKDSSQRTPLHLAAANGHTTIIKLLIGHAADVTAADKDQYTPLHIAVEKGQTECVKLLIHATDGTTLHLTNVNAVNKRKWTPLHLAAHHGYREITQLLIDTSSSVVDAQDKEGNTPLHMAAKNGHLDVAKLLINASANVDVLGNQKWTPLHLAARSGHKELVEVLLIHSADVNARDRNGKTPLDLATSSRRTEVVRLLSGLSGSERTPVVD